MADPGGASNAAGCLLGGYQRLRVPGGAERNKLTGAGSVLNTDRCEAGARLAVVGLGGMGFSPQLPARAIESMTLIAIDRLDSKLTLVNSVVATLCIRLNSPDAIERIKAQTNGGVDFAFEMAGSVAALEMAFRITHRGGTTVTAVLPS